MRTRLLLLLLLLAAPPLPGPVGAQTQDELLAAASNTRDWLYATHDYQGTRYVELDRIDTGNAHELEPVCVYQVGVEHNFQSNPIVYDGVMYVTTHRITVALDARTCQPRWKHVWRPETDEWRPVNRGVAIKEGVVVRGTADGYLIALDAITGEELWIREIADASLGESITMNPLIYEDVVLVGPAGSENAISGWVGAFSLLDGEPVWRFETVPGATENDSDTWGNPENIKLGGGAVWTPMALDAERGHLYVPVTNPAPDFPAFMRPGENLYSNSLVALDVRTGELVWYESLVPNDAHDWDLTHVAPLFTSDVGGRTRDLVASVGKDGVLRLLDRVTHERLWETAIARRENVDAPLTREGVFVCPGAAGGVEWNGPAYSRAADMLFVATVNYCGVFGLVEDVEFVPGRLYMGGYFEGDRSTRSGWLSAVDVATGEVRWRYESPQPMLAAVTATSGGVLFTGELTGDFITLDAETGEVLYRFNTGGPIGAGNATYELDGRQYVAVMSGRTSGLWYRDHPGAPTAFVFALPE